VFNVVHDLDAWKLWALNKGVHELVTAYVSFKPSDLHSYNPESETELLFASPRSWTAVSNILNMYGFNENDTIQYARIIGNLGQRVGQQFMAFCKYKSNTIDPMDIVTGVEKNFNSTSQEVIYITIQSVIKIVADRIIKEVESYQQVSDEAVIWAANSLRWIFTLRKEYAVMGYQDFVKYNQNTMRSFIMSARFRAACPELLKFVTENERIFY